MGYDPPIEENNEVNEPHAPYEKEADVLRASLLPWQERMREAVEMTLKEYGVTREELIARRGKLHITIHKGGGWPEH